MSKINQIQNKLHELDGGAFQKLADIYLYKRGYERINPIGSLIGADKVRKGTPDTFVSLPNGKYVFAEYTTQQEKLYIKLRSDLDKCFDENKTSIPLEKIEEIIFCHTSNLEAEEENALAEECQKHNVNLNIFGIGPISYDLYQKYPGLARDLLGIEVDSGQIVAPDEFVVTSNKNKLATRLDTTFLFREEETRQVLQGLELGSLVIVSGRAGVGKSRLALECCQQFKKMHPEYDIQCVFNKGPDIFEDLRVHFAESGCYLLLVDDANRLSKFDYVVQLLQNQRDDQQIKVIATVRDYALDKVREAARPCGGGTEIELNPLREDQIKQLVENEYSIRNPRYLDRIVDIAKGNPRLALMAAEIARRENTLQSIINVSQLYDEYFASIRQDIEEFGDQNLLKVAGIIAFFRIIDRSNIAMMKAIREAFEIYPDVLWTTAQRLHDLEVLDMFENEVVKVSDQVLATYLFYLAFFKERILNFSTLISHFFPRMRHRLTESINPVISTFDHRAIIEKIHPHVDKAWDILTTTSNEDTMLHFMEVFGLLKQTDTLLYIQNQIKIIEAEPIDISELNFKPDSSIRSPSLLNILRTFEYADDNIFRISLALLMEFLSKQPKELPKVLHILTKDFGFRHDSYLREFSIQQAVVDVLWAYSQNGEHELFSKVFLAVTKEYLHTHFLSSESKGSYAATIYNFELPSVPQIFSLRQSVWKHLFRLYQLESFQTDVLGIIYDQSRSGYGGSSNAILAEDAKEVLLFLASAFEPTNFRHCLIACEYFDLLDRYVVSFDHGLRDRFSTETYQLSTLLLSDWAEKIDLKMSYEEFQQFKNRQIEEYLAEFTLADYEQLLEQCVEIRAGLMQQDQTFQLQSGVTNVLLILANKDIDLYLDVLRYYLQLGDPFRLRPFALIANLLRIRGVEYSHEFINQPEYSTKRIWLFAFYQSLPAEQISAQHLNSLYALYQESEPFELPHSWDFLLKYHAHQKDIVVQVTRTILQKAEENPTYIYALSGLFYPDTEANKVIINLFASDFDLLKRAYLAVLKTDRHEDYNSWTLDRILDLDSNFILDYIDQIYEGQEWLSPYQNTRDFDFIWLRRDYVAVMTRIVERIYEHEKDRSLLISTYLESFFALRRDKAETSLVAKRQDHLLNALIECYYGDCDFMEYIFNVLVHFPPERRRQFISLFLEHNDTFDDFRRLPLEPNMWSWSGSAVPMLQGRMEYLESLLPSLNTVNFLQHKQYIEQRIQHIRSEIEGEKKSNFMED